MLTGELPQLSDGNFLLPKEEIIMHLQTVRDPKLSWILFCS